MRGRKFSVLLILLWAFGVSADSDPPWDLSVQGPIPISAVKALESLQQPPSNACEAGCSADPGTQFSNVLYDVKSPDGPALQVSTVSVADAQKIFSILAKRKEIPFKYPEDGCYARAEDMALIMDSMGVTSVKIFVEGNLSVATPNSPKGYVDWVYHVAPAVLVRDSLGNVITEIMDPSLFDHPATVTEWILTQTTYTNEQNPNVYFRSRFVYTNDTKDTHPSTYLPEDIDNMNKTMDDYMKIQKERQGGSQ